MSKGLEELKELKECIKLEGALDYINEERINIIEKKLKALAIIKEKDVHITLIKRCENASQYNRSLLGIMKKITAKKNYLSDEQFNTVKEVLL